LRINLQLRTNLPLFQIIFNPTSAAELARMPKELQLQILGEFRGLPQQVMQTELGEFGKLERAGRSLHRFRVGDYRVYFERHELGLVVHRILSRHTLKDFLFRSGLKMQEDEALQQNPKFWELIEAAKIATRKES
jgi:mRNA-degrading endonuclease RelE of RelBE toxin-antitoxin system